MDLATASKIVDNHNPSEWMWAYAMSRLGDSFKESELAEALEEACFQQYLDYWIDAGCIRLLMGDDEFLYELTPLGEKFLECRQWCDQEMEYLDEEED